MKLTVALATYNEEKNLRRCLESVKNLADEIILVDGESKDKTVEIAKEFNTKVEVTDNPPIFHINKQKSINMAKCEWILQLDADEVVTDELKNEIVKIINSPLIDFNGYWIPRKNYFLGHWMKKGGLYPDYIIRLFKSGKGNFPCKNVHEQIIIEGRVGYLKSPLLHYPYNNLSEYWEKAKRYSLLVGMDLKNNQKKISIFVIFDYLFIKPLSTFISLFIRHLGFFDGIYGFLFAFLSGIQNPLSIIYFIKNK